MCTLLLAWRADPDYPLVIAANRDEFYARPTDPASFWDDHPDVLAGRDRKAGGTWLGITRSGRWAGLTNVRDPGADRRDARSRGHLVSEFLTSDVAPAEYARATADAGAGYKGFNLLVGDAESAWYASNYLPGDGGARGGARDVMAGIHGVSNHLLNTPWPKVEQGREMVRRALAAHTESDASWPTALFDGLADARPHPDDSLPDTGVGIEWERKLSSLFIATPVYGTCCSTVIAVHRSGRVHFFERTTNPTRELPSPVAEHFVIERPEP